MAVYYGLGKERRLSKFQW